MNTSSLLLLVVVSGCAGRQAPSVEPTQDQPATAGSDIPQDSASRRFAERLVEARITDWRPSSGGAVDFRYKKMDFKPDNTWHADAALAVMDEEVPCMEQGGWSMEPAESDSVATVMWTVDETTCPGRDAGQSFRAEFTVERDGSYQILLR